MTLGTKQKEALFSIFESSGFRYFDKSKYIFEGNIKKGTINSFLKQLGAPDCFKTEELALLGMAYKEGNVPVKELGVIIEEWSVDRRSESALATVDLSEEELSEAEDVNSFVKSLVPTVNVTRNAKDKVILLDPYKEYRPALDIDPEFFMIQSGTSYQELAANPRVKKVMTCFDPYTLKSLFVRESKSSSIKMHHVNYYIAPRWRFVPVKPAFEGFIKKLIEHLFPDEGDRNYVLDWLHFALVRRNETVLCLIGSRGTGKGLLLNNIMEQLLGTEYHEVAKQQVLVEKFNPEFKNKRHVYFDEVDVSGEKELNRFKALANNKISLESKGVDAETIDNYASMSLTSNSKKDFRAEPQDRRFSVPEVTSRPFLEICTEEEIAQFCMRIRDPESEEIAAFGNWLLARVPVNSNHTPLKGRYFFELCRLSMPEWKAFIIDYFLNEGQEGTPVPASILKKHFIKLHGEEVPFVTKKGSYESFLGDYLHEGRYRIGKVMEAYDTQRRRDTFSIMPDPDFLMKFGKQYQEPSAEDQL
jgi:hypothetical protein